MPCKLGRIIRHVKGLAVNVDCKRLEFGPKNDDAAT